MRRKKEISKQGQTNKAKQHSTPKAVTFPRKNELPQVGLEPTTLYTLDRALYQLSYRGSSAGWAQISHMYIDGILLISFLSKASKMSSSINCNFARCAVQHFMSTHMKGNLLQKGKMAEILRDYNRNFASVHGLQVTYGIAAKRFQAICRIFNNKWRPQETKGAYLSVFSVEAWKVLSQEEREKHAQIV